MAIATKNPTTGELVKSFDPLSAQAIEERLARAVAAFERQRTRSMGERARHLRAAARALESDKRRFAELMTLEMGKPITQSIAEVEKCAWVCNYYADNAASLLADEPAASDASESYVRYDPIGAVLAIMPWNFPFWQVFRFAAPALAAGNVGLLKHASNVPQCSLSIQDVFANAGFDEGAFQSLLVEAQAVESIIADDRVKAVTLTGSDAAGRTVAAKAGAQIKKTVLELGGSDPFVVFGSADLDSAAATAVSARTINSGQSCIAAKRFIVERSVADTFTRKFVEGFEKLVVGDPMDPKTQVGPLATEQVLATTERQVADLVKAGGRILTGGKRLTRPGYYFAPTVIADVPHDAPAAEEEIFAPVALLYQANSFDDAIKLANFTPFGLGASVWTNDAGERARAIAALDSGSVFVNGMVKSDPRLPFGGTKQSGYGRELGRLGILEFVNAKTVWIK